MWMTFAVQSLLVAALVQRPSDAALFGVLLLVCFAIATTRGWQMLMVFVSLAVATVWLVGWHVGLRDAVMLDSALSGVVVDADVVVSTTPRQSVLGVSFDVEIADPTLPRRMRVRWPQTQDRPVVREGQCWRLRLRLQPLAATRNPGVFDYAAWQRAQRIGGAATVRRSRANRLCARQRSDPLLVTRQRIRDSLARSGISAQADGLLRALLIGERQALDPATREVFARTGTAHLMAISGLHIGLVAALGYFAGRRLPLMRAALPADRGIVLGGGLAAAYAALSGFALPAQRALIMLSLLGLVHHQRRNLDGLRLVAFAALALIFVDPLQVTRASFAFSFAAVTLLAVAQLRMRCTRDPGRMAATRRIVAAQALLGVGLAPLSLAWFGYVSSVGIGVNLIVVPVFSILIVPLALIGALLALVVPVLAPPLWWLNARLLDVTVGLLSWVSAWPQAAVSGMPPSSALLLLLTGCAVYLALLAGWPGRLLAVPALMAALLARGAAPPYGCIDVTLLDVGHGTSLSLSDARAAHLYDTGPSWAGGADAGERIVLPYLTARGITHIALAIVSHDDADHSGGAQSLYNAGVVRRWLGAFAVAPACRAGQRWHSAGIVFHVLWPLDGNARESLSDNDSSCVLRVTTGGASLLITGDIERIAERELVAMRLPVTALITLPHHGSATSSTGAFIDSVQARTGWVSTAGNGRWQLPHPDVLPRWQGSGVSVHSTAAHGALQARLCRTPE